ncbi:amidohydrolase family protein [Auricularia subglabra TFB-10046 SS5]|nr:amidohydrolase family protein [Auricularia subglabra TFB-10046 SS5]
MRCLALSFALVTLASGALGDIVLRGGTVVAFDLQKNALDVMPDTDVHIVGDSIAGLHRAGSGFVPPKGTEVVDVTGDIVTPGFADMHRHSWQTAFRTLASNTTLPEYALRYGSGSPAQRLFTAEDVYAGQLAALYESLNSGVTIVLDHAHHTFSNATAAAGLQASIDSGLRVFWCYAIQSLNNGFTINEQFANVRELFNNGTWRKSATRIGIAFDQLQEPLTQFDTDVFNLAHEIQAPVFTMHFLAGPWGGDSLPQALNRLGFLNNTLPIVLSHGSFITTTDMNLLRSTNQYLAITPESEMHYGHDHQFSQLIMDQAALGVDTHFTYSADIVGQARIWLQGTRLQRFREELTNSRIAVNNPMSANQAFLLATRNAGLALRRDDVGLIRVGGKADVVVFDGASPNMLGWSDPVAAVILHSHVSDVKHVLVDGGWRKRDGKIVFGDFAALQKRFLKSRDRIQALWRQMDFPPFFSGPFRPGAAQGVVIPNLDAQRGDGTGY